MLLNCFSIFLSFSLLRLFEYVSIAVICSNLRVLTWCRHLKLGLSVAIEIFKVAIDWKILCNWCLLLVSGDLGLDSLIVLVLIGDNVWRLIWQVV